MPAKKVDHLVAKAEEFMIDSFLDHRSKIPRVIGDGMVRHNLQTREYVRQLCENREDTAALEVAALLHNIERAFRKTMRYNDLENKEHGVMSAQITEEFLKKNKAPKEFIAQVKELVRWHSKGGKGDLQIICEADNISFLENTLPIWFEVGLWMGQSKEDLIEASRKKVEREWKQLKSKRAKEIAKKFYDKWLHWLTQKEEVIKSEPVY